MTGAPGEPAGFDEWKSEEVTVDLSDVDFIVDVDFINLAFMIFSGPSGFVCQEGILKKLR